MVIADVDISDIVITDMAVTDVVRADGHHAVICPNDMIRWVVTDVTDAVVADMIERVVADKAVGDPSLGECTH